ncbi:MAG: FAD-dependent oxidoreductase [Anaerolineales bacterium]|nr:FAD-dependent oxidoreductase [Anaerolineales bacterium]
MSSQIGTVAQPLRVAIIGSGPAGFYAAEHLLKQHDVVVQVDMFDRLPTPFGLVRAGVAPDHQKIKSVTRAFERVAEQPGFRFFGYVEIGKDISVAELRQFYHQIVYATGAQTDRALDIPGIDLAGSHAATEFVAWYNGHPDYRNCEFDLSQERAVVIGIGNVAVDVARILCSTPEELAKTDIATYALEALQQSKVREVVMVGRRGVAQAAYSAPEIKELGELAETAVYVHPDEVTLDPLSAAALEEADRSTKRMVEITQGYAGNTTDKPRKLTIRFLLSPTELWGDESGQVTGMRLVRNELVAGRNGRLGANPTDQFEEIETGLVFRSIGYRGVPMPGVPFREDWGVIWNEHGRVVDAETHQPVIGEYTTGWIKRGPSGIIGTNKPDAVETVSLMLEDMQAGQIQQPDCPEPADAEAFIRQRQPNYFSYQDWQTLDRLEQEAGAALGRPRVKFTTIEEMLAAREEAAAQSPLTPA